MVEAEYTLEFGLIRHAGGPLGFVLFLLFLLFLLGRFVAAVGVVVLAENLAGCHFELPQDLVQPHPNFAGLPVGHR